MVLHRVLWCLSSVALMLVSASAEAGFAAAGSAVSRVAR